MACPRRRNSPLRALRGPYGLRDTLGRWYPGRHIDARLAQRPNKDGERRQVYAERDGPLGIREEVERSSLEGGAAIHQYDRPIRLHDVFEMVSDVHDPHPARSQRLEGAEHVRATGTVEHRSR